MRTGILCVLLCAYEMKAEPITESGHMCIVSQTIMVLITVAYRYKILTTHGNPI